MWKALCGLEALIIGGLLYGIDLTYWKGKIVATLEDVIARRFKDERAGSGDHIIDEPDDPWAEEEPPGEYDVEFRQEYWG